jgi:hypothetical protein
LSGGIEKNHDNPVSIAGDAAEIRTKYLPNKIQKGDRSTEQASLEEIV